MEKCFTFKTQTFHVVADDIQCHYRRAAETIMKDAGMSDDCLMFSAISLRTSEHKRASWGLCCAVCEFSHHFTFLKDVSLLSWCEAADTE